MVMGKSHSTETQSSYTIQPKAKSELVTGCRGPVTIKTFPKTVFSEVRK